MELQGLVDTYAVLVTEQQLHLADVVGERDYAVDLDTGTITFGGARVAARFACRRAAPCRTPYGPGRRCAATGSRGDGLKALVHG